jgi:asparagine synthase (glutamine-hydrolysing)
VRQYCTVALGGDGGDELFAGYAGYSNLLWMQQRLRMVPGPLRKVVGGAAEHLLPVGLKGRNYLQGLNVDLDRGLPFLANLFDPTTRRKLLRADARQPLWAEDIRKARVPLERDLLQRATRMDFTNYLAEDILVKVDRASMLNSLEVRAPLLDVRVIEFAFRRVPSRLKATSNSKKILLKRLAARLLPPKFDLHRKQGFSVPMSRWLKTGPLRDMCGEVLADPASVFDRRAVSSLLRGQDRGRSNGERLFAIVLFELWRREYGITDIAG